MKNISEKDFMVGVIRAPKELGIEKIDRKDIRILYELIKNSRTSIATIAKRVSLSQEVVNYRIHKLIKKGIIVDFYTEIDLEKLGFQRYNVFLKIRPANDEQMSEMIDFLVNHPFIRWAMEFEGKFDIGIGINATDIKHFDNILSSIINKYNPMILDYVTSIIVEAHQTSMKYIMYKQDLPKAQSNPKKDSSFAYQLAKAEQKETTPEINIDVHDLKILEILNRDARAPLSYLGKITGLSRDAAKYRIEKMIKQGIIKDFQLRINQFKLGFNSNTLFLKLKSFDKERKKRIINSIKAMPLVNFVSKRISPWNWSVITYYRDINEFNEFITELKKLLKDDIINYESIMESDQYKATFLTSGVIQTLREKLK